VYGRRVTARALHTAALPFPSSQGTQAALLAIVCAVARDAATRGERVALLTYEAGDGRRVLPENVEHRRTRAPVSNRSLRSGPSLPKLAEDLGLIEALRRAPEGEIVAHHIEAGLACVLAGRPFTWVAHTALGPELPLYGRRALAPLFSRAGESLDRFVATRASRVFAISPFLARRIEAHASVQARVLPTPWAAAPPIDAHERLEARASFGFAGDHEVVLYAGNLDRYQGLDSAVEAIGALAHRRARLRWLVASESSPGPLLALADRAGIRARITIAPLESDAQRRRAHAAADVAIVPRRLEAGLSIKILESLAHSLPTVVVRAAAGGFPLEEACRLVDDAPGAIAGALRDVLAEPFARLALGAAGPAYLARHHTDRACLDALHTERARHQPGA
jgi:glycosyltransferase involved in cell wall biosynthesis